MINYKIPGRLHQNDTLQLAELVDGKCVLQLGCYCGRGLLVVANVAVKTWVLDDFVYPGGVEGVVEELKANVNRLADLDDVIYLLYGTVDNWAIPLGSEPLQPERIEVVYRDANRPAKERERDERFALGVLHGRKGIYAWHDEDHNLRWLKIEPVPVEVN